MKTSDRPAEEHPIDVSREEMGFVRYGFRIAECVPFRVNFHCLEHEEEEAQDAIRVAKRTTRDFNRELGKLIASYVGNACSNASLKNKSRIGLIKLHATYLGMTVIMAWELGKLFALCLSSSASKITEALFQGPMYSRQEGDIKGNPITPSNWLYMSILDVVEFSVHYCLNMLRNSAKVEDHRDAAPFEPPIHILKQITDGLKLQPNKEGDVRDEQT